MAVNFTDFSRAPLLESPFATSLEDVLKGYKIAREPANMAMDEKKKQLVNDLAQLELEHKPTEYELSDQGKRLANALHDAALKHRPTEYRLSDALKQAQIDKANRTTGGSSLKPNATVANAEYIWNLEHQNGEATPEEQKEHLEFLKKAFQSGVDRTESLTHRAEDITAAGAFDKLPANEKKRAVAFTTGLGIDPIEGTHMLRSGKTLKEIAESKGEKLENVVPIYPLETENVKQLQRRRGFVEELKNLESKTAEPLSKYPSKVRGYSLDQIVDSLDIKSPDEMGRVLAARALSPEIAALRLKVAGGNIGIEAINELQSKSMTQLNVVEALVDAPTYLAMQKYMTEWLEEASNTFENTLNDYNRLRTPEDIFKSNQQRSADKESSQASSHHGKTYDLATRSWK